MKSSEIRENRKTAILGTLAGWLMKLWSFTLRYEIEDRCGITRPGTHAMPVIFALWHNRIFTLPPIWSISGGNQRKSVVLTSASHDGAMLARAMAVFGLGSVRGSSSPSRKASTSASPRTARAAHVTNFTPASSGSRNPPARPSSRSTPLILPHGA
jgi:lysophospholipid acyltransferase (LPLAT)-like uncharacterized protein